MFLRLFGRSAFSFRRVRAVQDGRVDSGMYGRVVLGVIWGRCLGGIACERVLMRYNEDRVQDRDMSLTCTFPV